VYAIVPPVMSNKNLIVSGVEFWQIDTDIGRGKKYDSLTPQKTASLPIQLSRCLCRTLVGTKNNPAIIKISRE